jgi:ribonuclease D
MEDGYLDSVVAGLDVHHLRRLQHKINERLAEYGYLGATEGSYLLTSSSTT